MSEQDNCTRIRNLSSRFTYLVCASQNEVDVLVGQVALSLGEGSVLRLGGRRAGRRRGPGRYRGSPLGRRLGHLVTLVLWRETLPARRADTTPVSTDN